MTPRGGAAFSTAAGALLDPWRAAAYRAPSRYAGGALRAAPAGLLTGLAQDLLPLVEATLRASRRDDGLYHAYNLVDLATPGRCRGEPALPDARRPGGDALQRAALARPRRWRCWTPCSPAPCTARGGAASCCTRTGRCRVSCCATGWMPRPWPCRWCSACWPSGREDLLQRESDGTVRFAPGLSNRGDLEAVGADLGPELATGPGLRTCAGPRRLHRPLRHDVRLRRAGLHLLAHGGQTAAGGAGAGVRRTRRRRTPSCRR
jgi:hypothetical protein